MKKKNKMVKEIILKKAKKDGGNSGIGKYLIIISLIINN